uniref:TROVE domain-containing protein n=1 Tax=Onchocerca volvulus TaxID=6282 RepID=A0A8R1TSJ6_ONCVO
MKSRHRLVTDIGVAGNQLFPTPTSDEEFVRRFLMLGNCEGIYFARQKVFTSILVPDLCRIIQAGKGLIILQQILKFSQSNYAPRIEPLLIALALCARYKVRDTQSKRKLPWDTKEDREKLFPDAVCRDIRPVMENTYQKCLQQLALFSVHKVCLTPTHLFMFINYCKVVSKQSGLKKDSNGWGRALRATVIKWYYNQTPDRLAVMVTKYRHRINYSHRDLFCLSHIHPKQSFPPECNYRQHQQDYENIIAYVVRGSEKVRKRRQELFLKRQSKRQHLDPEETERVRQDLEELNLKRTEKEKASEDVEVTTSTSSREVAGSQVTNALKYIDAFEELQNLTSANIDRAVSLILQYGNKIYELSLRQTFILLTFSSRIVLTTSKVSFEKEQIPEELLNSKKVWGALLRRMSLPTMLKNIGRMSGIELFNEADDSVFGDLSDVLNNITWFFYDDDKNYTNFTKDDPASLVIRRLNDIEKLKQERLHPLAILFAKMNYEHGHEMRGNRMWKPVRSIQKAFDNAFYNCFDAVEVTNKHYLIAVDISDSMDSFIQGTMLACSQAAATLSMALIQHEDNVIPLAFSNFLTPLEWDKFMSLGEYLSATKELIYGKTDCGLPMCWAIENAVYVDVFIILTDNDVSVKSIKPSDAIQWYREQMDVPNAKLIVIAMSGKSESLANPSDPNMLVIYGMNPSVPQIIDDFIRDFQTTH